MLLVVRTEAWLVHIARATIEVVEGQLRAADVQRCTCAVLQECEAQLHERRAKVVVARSL